ncbi:HAD family hydrolase [Gryllotalpicola ginsengisoli]|uniref:HAD family hydrolase n=1 Tax=Gryllotalpicola ginsengisoli TaxID=444608 RepID=UPI000407FF2F|nr:HAD family hydrolase [Gryllotalpicola ginsengisoli]
MTSACVLVFDFDGTVSLGDEPVVAYARHLDEEAGSATGLITRVVSRFLQCDGRLDRALEGLTDADPVFLGLHVIDGAIDGYAAAARLATLIGLQQAQIDAAYTASRADLADGLISTRAPEGFASFLAAFPPGAHRVLVSNSPANGLIEQIDKLGLTRSFDEVVTSANKPAGLPAILERLLAEHGLADAPDRLLSVGDIWVNDLAPAAQLGAATALIDRMPVPEGAAPTVRAPQIEELYPWMLDWASGRADRT